MSFRFPQVATVSLLAALSTAPAQQTLRGSQFQDKSNGFRIVLPNKWEQLPINVNANLVVAWFQSKSLFRGDASKGDTGKARRAYLGILRLAEPGSYRKRLDRLFKPGRYQATSEAGRVHGSVPVVKWDVKHAVKGRDRERVIAWVFRRGEEEFVAEYRLLEAQVGTSGEQYRGSLRTFKFIAQTGKPIEVYGNARAFALNDWLGLSVIERHRRRAAEGARHEKMILDRLPEGWRVRKSEHYLIVSDADPKVTKYVESTLITFRKWLDARFGKLWEDQPIRTTIRLCKNATEYRSYRRGGVRKEYSFENREVVMCNDRGNLNLKDVFWRVFHRYMLDAAPEVYFNLPHWMRESMRHLFLRVRVSKKGLTFPLDKQEARIFYNLERKGQPPLTFEQLLRFPDRSAGPKRKGVDFLGMQWLTLFRFLDGPGRRSKALRRRDIFADYLLEVRKLAREMDAKDPNVLVWDSEERLRTLFDERRAAAAKQVGEKKARDRWPTRLPSLDSRWSSYEKIRKARAAEFHRLLFERVGTWSKMDGIRLQRAYEKFCDSTRR